MSHLSAEPPALFFFWCLNDSPPQAPGPPVREERVSDIPTALGDPCAQGAPPQNWPLKRAMLSGGPGEEEKGGLCNSDAGKLKACQDAIKLSLAQQSGKKEE